MTAEERQTRPGSIADEPSGNDPAVGIALPEDHEPIITGYVDVESGENFTIQVIRDLVLAVIAAFFVTTWICVGLLDGTGVLVFALVFLPSLVGAFWVIRKLGSLRMFHFGED